MIHYQTDFFFQSQIVTDMVKKKLKETNQEMAIQAPARRRGADNGDYSMVGGGREKRLEQGKT